MPTMPTPRHPKILLVGLDGLRPDLLGPELTPHLWSFARDHVRFARHRAIYPTETYPNVASLLTGAVPATHGIVANEFLVPSFDRHRTWMGADLDRVERWNEAHGGRFHRVPTLGDVLGAAGMTFWAISTETAGSSRLMHPTADRHPGHLCLLIKAFDRSRPAGVSAEVVALAGPLPERLPPDVNLDDQRYATDAFLALERARGMPDLAVVWYGGTDHALHVHGLGAPETRWMINQVDAEFGRLLEWWRAHPEHDRIQVVAVSDHGHVTQTRKVNVKAVLSEAGFAVGTHLEGGAEIAHNSCYGWSGNVRVRGGDAGLVKAVCHALMEHPAIGLVFTRGRDGIHGAVEGTLAQELVGISHPGRSADVDYCLRDHEELDPFGLPGTCWADNSQRLLASNHGGFHPKVMEAILLLGGSAFRRGREITTPSGIADVAPTLLHLLGLPAGSTTGRVLREAWAPAEDPGVAEELRWTAGRRGFAQEVLADRVAGITYLRCGRRIAAP